MSRPNSRLSIPAAITDRRRRRDRPHRQRRAPADAGAGVPPTTRHGCPRSRRRRRPPRTRRPPTPAPRPPRDPGRPRPRPRRPRPRRSTLTASPTTSRRVDLDVATTHDVRVTVVDDGGSLVGIKSGHAGDGMSVRWFDLKVENVDSSTLRLTWIGFAADDESVLNVGENDGRVQLALSVAGPPPNSDATGYDRVLILEFDHDVERRRRHLHGPGRLRHELLSRNQQGPDGPDPRAPRPGRALAAGPRRARRRRAASASARGSGGPSPGRRRRTRTSPGRPIGRGTGGRRC